MPLLLTKLNAQQRKDHVMTALKLVGLGERVGHLPKQLSGGQEQRVAIARAIVSDPTLLLADEPTGDLDSNSATEVLEILKRLNEDFHKTDGDGDARSACGFLRACDPASGEGDVASRVDAQRLP